MSRVLTSCKYCAQASHRATSGDLVVAAPATKNRKENYGATAVQLQQYICIIVSTCLITITITDTSIFIIKIKWWLGMHTSKGLQCTLCPGITLDPLIQPSSLHFPSLALCFLCLVDRVAVSAVTPASSKVEELRQWSDRQVKSSRLSHTQLGNKMSAGREWRLSEHF